VERTGCHAGNADRLPAQTVNLSYGIWPGRGPPSRKCGSFAAMPHEGSGGAGTPTSGSFSTFSCHG